MVELLFESFVFIIKSSIAEETDDHIKTQKMKQKQIDKLAKPGFFNLPLNGTTCVQPEVQALHPTLTA